MCSADRVTFKKWCNPAEKEVGERDLQSSGRGRKVWALCTGGPEVHRKKAGRPSMQEKQTKKKWSEESFQLCLSQQAQDNTDSRGYAGERSLKKRVNEKLNGQQSYNVLEISWFSFFQSSRRLVPTSITTQTTPYTCTKEREHMFSLLSEWKSFFFILSSDIKWSTVKG